MLDMCHPPAAGATSTCQTPAAPLHPPCTSTSQTTGSKPLLDEQDLGVMFGMYDQTHKGVVTAGQADNALRTVLGAAAGAGAADPQQKLRQGEFVEYMSGVMRKATPYCQQPQAPGAAAAVSKG